MSERTPPDPNEHDDWFAGDGETGAPADPGRQSGDAPSSNSADFFASETDEPDPADMAAATRKDRRRAREEQRTGQTGESDGLAAGGAGFGATLRGMFGRGSSGSEAGGFEDEGDAIGDGSDATVGVGPEEVQPDVEGSTGSLGADSVVARTNVGAEEANAVAEALRMRRRGGSGRGSGSSLYLRRRLMALGGVVGVILVVVVLVVALGSSGSPEPQPQPAAVPTLDVTIPEGFSRNQIADVAKESGVGGNYKADSKKSKDINLKKYGAGGAETLEGFLFPDTYALNEGDGAKDLVSLQLDNFKTKIKDVDMKFAESKNLNTYDVLKIASMIEREIMVPEERRLAAAVIYNRLAIGQALGIDSTIRFEDGNYNKQLTAERLATDSPFNTRIRTGLPPTPIGNPGLASIKAAANPAKSDVRFFVVKPGTCGEHTFTDNEEEFFAAEAKYQAALEAEGGSPTECP